MPRLKNKEPKPKNMVSVPVQFETNEILNQLSERTGLKKYRLIDTAVGMLVESIKNREKLEKRTQKRVTTK